MKKELPKGAIFMTGRNCQSYVANSIGSLAQQKNQHFEILFIDDASTDSTAEAAKIELEKFFPGKHSLIKNIQQKGKARNAYEQLPKIDAEFVAILDADDRLIDNEVLQEMAEAYAHGYDAVWTNYKTDRGNIGNNRALDPFQSPRTQGWRTSHFFSFRKNLFNLIPESNFQDDEGDWLMAACDFAIAYPILDQTRRYLHLPKNSYQYTESNPESHHNVDDQSRGLNSRLQQNNALLVLNKKPLDCHRFLSEVPGLLEQALGSKISLLEKKIDHVLQGNMRLEKICSQTPFVTHATNNLADKENIPTHWLRTAGGWALDAEFLNHLSSILNQYKNPRVLEFGSGRGTKILAQICGNRGGRLTSIEHDESWHMNTSSELNSLKLNDFAIVKHCPLVDLEFMGVPGKFYDMSWLTEEDIFDVVIIDGPPAKTIPFARLPALPTIAKNLAREKFHIFLDDYEREEEKRIVEVWQAVAPELRYETITFQKDVCSITN